MTAPRAARVETPADTLRRASARVRELAAAVPDIKFHGLPLWDAVAPMVGCSRLNAVSLAPAGEWIAALNPAVAEPLAAWLDWEADEQEERTEECVECRGSGEVFDGDPLPFDCTDCVARRPLNLARVLLGSPVPEPDGEATT